MTPRSVRNNNPTNMDAGDPWRGLVPRENMTPEQKAEPRFAVFVSPQYGFRAAAIQLRNYERKDGANTVRKIINRWAPPVENDTGAYVAHVAEQMNVKPDDVIQTGNPGVLFDLIKAIATHETGSWSPYWTDQELAEGLQLAGFQP